MAEIRYKRAWSMANGETYNIPPIQQLLKNEMGDGFWLDPFARNSKLASVTNDLDPQTSADYHMDASQFLLMFKTNSVDGILIDPPYSLRQVSELYKKLKKTITTTDTSSKPLAMVKDLAANLIKPGGKCITFGWNSTGLGKERGFENLGGILVNHGGSKNDTIVTIERKQIIS